jgi:hypothetical protein
MPRPATPRKLDLYLPAHAKKPYPVVLAIHGGVPGSRGDKATGEVNPEMEALKIRFRRGQHQLPFKQRGQLPCSFAGLQSQPYAS